MCVCINMYVLCVYVYEISGTSLRLKVSRSAVDDRCVHRLIKCMYMLIRHRKEAKNIENPFSKIVENFPNHGKYMDIQI